MTTRRYWVHVAAVAALYVGAARVGFLVAIPPGNVTVAFPPSGISLAALLLLGRRVWPGIWVGSFAANFWFFQGSSQPFFAGTLVSAVIGAGSTVQALVGAALLQRFLSPGSIFARTADVVRFTAIEALSCTIAATVGNTALSLGGVSPWGSYGRVWSTWYLGDLVGVLLITPLVLSWARPIASRWSPARVLEALMLSVAVLATGSVVLSAPFHGVSSSYSRDYFFIPLVVWAAVRFGQRGVTLTAAAASATVVWAAIRAGAPEGGAATLLSLQTFSSVVALTGLLLATALEGFQEAENELRDAHRGLENRVLERTTELARANLALRAEMAERLRAEHELGEREVLLHGLFERAPDAILAVGSDGRVIRANARVHALFGWEPEEIVGSPVETLLPESYRSRHGEHRRDYSDRPRLRPMGAGLDLYGRRKDGSEFPVDIMLSPLESASGPMVIAIVRDITGRKKVEEQLRRTGEQLRALAAREQDVREHERTRMAREVHDELGQSLTGLKMELAWTGRQLAGSPDAAAATLGTRVKSLTALIDGMIEAVRRIASDLRPGVLDDLGLVAAIEWQARDFEQRTGIACTLTAPADDIPIERDAATAAFRIFQEILTNVARHSRGSNVEASLSTEGKNFVLEVKDDGRGITDNELAGRGSLGLLGMRERAVVFGGDVKVVAGPGKGTTVTVTLPCVELGTTSEKKGSGDGAEERKGEAGGWPR